MTAVTWEQVAAWRMERQGLNKRVPRSKTLDVVSRICGLHAQVMSCAELTLQARVNGISRAEIQQALLEERTLVKSWFMRGTLHLVRADEYGLYRGAVAHYDDRHTKGAWQKAYLPGDQMELLLKALPKVLRNKELTREELAAAVAESTGSKRLATGLSGSWGSVLKPAAFAGALCFGRPRAQRVTFTSPRSWIPGGFESPDGERALRDVVGRILVATGPLTLEEVARYLGSPPSVARRVLVEIAEEVEVAGETRHVRKGDARRLAKAAPKDVVRLVPAFDQYVVGASRHSARLMDGDHAAKVYRPQGWLSPVILHDGRMLGTWTREKGRIVLQPFAKNKGLPPGVDAEVERLDDWFAA